MRSRGDEMGGIKQASSSSWVDILGGGREWVGDKKRSWGREGGIPARWRAVFEEKKAVCVFCSEGRGED